MLREILFRGKRVDNGEWVCGGYWQPHDPECLEPNGECYIIVTEDLGDVIGSDEIEVVPSTVGQFTGKKCNSKSSKAFDGDLFKDQNGRVWGIEYDDFNSCFVAFDPRRRHSSRYLHAFEVIEIIGNIHDNPELIGKEVNHA